MKTKNIASVCAIAVAVVTLFSSCSNDATTAGNENGGRKANDNQSAYVALADAGACDNSRYGKEIYVASESRYYVCDGISWIATQTSASSLEMSSGSANGSPTSFSSDEGLGVCMAANDGELKQDYVCDNGEWRMATDSEKEVGFGCTASGIGKERLVAGYMLCSEPGVWTVTTHTVEGNYGGTKTIGIGTQTWAVLNSDAQYKVNGEDYGNLCYGNGNNVSNCHQKCPPYHDGGVERLYSWAAAMDTANTGCGKGKTCVASSGRIGCRGFGSAWHLPSKEEWKVLLAGIGGENAAKESNPLKPVENVVGRMLKSTKGWYGGGNGENAYGFAAVPSGEYRYIDRGDSYSAFDNKSTCFWSSSEDAEYPDYAYCVCLSYDSESARLLRFCDKSAGHVIRCLRD